MDNYLFPEAAPPRKIYLRIRNAAHLAVLSNILKLKLKDDQSIWIDDENGNSLLGSQIEKQKAEEREPPPHHWYDMPRYVQNKVIPHATILLYTKLQPERLSEILRQPITAETKSIWFPKLNRQNKTKAWQSNSGIVNKYPIFIISKGRPACITAKALQEMGADFTIVVEPQELALYQETWGRHVIAGEFDRTTRSSIPVRNYVDKISPTNWYWLMDDNMAGFYYMTDNNKFRVQTPAIFAALEDFVARFSNVGQAGFNYYSFGRNSDALPPYYLNSRIYSCTLMRRDVDIVRENGNLWRGRYNEDTDLSLRILKAGYCTILSNAFLTNKAVTMTMKGGNTDSVYVDGDNRRKFAESLYAQHPDVTKIIKRFGRWHHYVNYAGYTNPLIPRENQPAPRDYGLFLAEYNGAEE